jgi:hypothetical protein
MLRGEVLRRGPGVNWTNHRRVRLRSFLTSLEEMLGELEAVCAHPEPGDPDFESVIAALRERADSWKSRTQETAAMLENVQALARAAQTAANRLDTGSPRPRPEFRFSPRA